MSDELPSTVHFLLDLKDEAGLSLGRYMTATMAAVLVADGTSQIRNASRTWYSDPNAKWADFVVSAQLDPSSTDWYGRRMQYTSVYSVGLPDAEVMVRHLRDMTRRVEKLEARFGTATDFAGFMARVADAAGCGDHPFIRLHRSGPGFGYDSNEYRFMNADALRYHLNDEVQKWRDKHGFTVAS